MSVALTGGSGWFTRLGLELGEVNRIATACFGTVLDTAVSNIFAAHTSAEQREVSQLYQYRDTVRQQAATYVSQLQAQATAVAVAQVDRDSPLPPGGKTPANAVARVITQMKGTSDTIQRAVTSAVVTAASGNKGDAVVKVGLTDAYGLPLDMVMAETLTATVTADTGNGGATKYGEPLAVVGQPAQPISDYRWPAGSAASQTLKVSDAADTGVNLLANGDFSSWGGTGNNTPGTWAMLTGAAGTQILRGSTSPLRSADGTQYYCTFKPDGSTLTEIAQAVTLKPLTVYAVHLFLRIDASDAQSFRVRLIDGNGATVADDAGTNLTKSTVLSGIGSNTWTSVYAFWATPRIVPAGTRLAMGFVTTSPSSSRTVDVDLASLVAATQLYPGGPFAAAFSKETQSAKNDYYSIAVANNLSRWSFARSLDGLFNLRQNGLSFPSALSPSVPDSLIAAAT